MLNNLILMGRLTATPELKTTPNGVSVTTFCVAVERSYQKDGQKQTDFINCVAWRNTAEFITRYFSKGEMIALICELQSRKYTDKDGNQRSTLDVVVNQAKFCGGKNAGTTDAATIEFDDVAEDDLPF